MNYGEMSDFEINKAVATVLKQDIKSYVEVVMIWNGQEYCEVDYCNNPSDSWEIITTGIGLIAENGKIIGATNNSQEYYEPYGSKVFDYLDKNPLRAAMVVFLMMNEEQK